MYQRVPAGFEGRVS